jgi:trans-aconitate 2-methyltransferase
MWDADQYLKYAEERARPFFDMLARVRTVDAEFIADLGCGPGNLTRTLAERWPAAKIVGIDNSVSMLEQARASALAGRLDFVHADLATWTPERPVDLLVSNAALQWVPDHAALIPRLAGMLSVIGTLAVQMPYHFHNPAHLIIEETKADRRWAAALKGVGLHQQAVLPLVWYVERLLELGFSVDAWQTTYIHVLTGENPVLEWFKGTALRPLLSALEPAAQSEFLHELGNRLRGAYPAKNGLTLLPFPRLFLVAKNSPRPGNQIALS